MSLNYYEFKLFYYNICIYKYIMFNIKKTNLGNSDEKETLLKVTENTSNSNSKENNIEEEKKNLDISNTEIKKYIEDLSEIEQAEIYKIIKLNNENFSINTNGIFFNLSKISNLSKQQIISFIFFCKNNNNILNNDEKNRDQYKRLL